MERDHLQVLFIGKMVDKFGFGLIKYSGNWQAWGVKSLESCLKAKEYWGISFWCGNSTFSFDLQIFFSNFNIYVKQNFGYLSLLSSCEAVLHKYFLVYQCHHPKNMQRSCLKDSVLSCTTEEFKWFEKYNQVLWLWVLCQPSTNTCVPVNDRQH